MQSVGVIGGYGPETTAGFYLEVILQCQKLNNTHHPSIVIANVPSPNEFDRDLIATNTGIERYIPFLIAEAKRLEKSGVDFLVMPCNSLHVFIEDIRSAISIPMLSIVEETIKHIKQSNFSHIGLISTSATIANNVYESRLQENDIRFIVPDGLQQAKMDQVIQRLIRGSHLNKDREAITNVIEGLVARGVDCVVLACTDLQLLLPQREEVVVLDTMKILADSTAQEIFHKG